MKYTMTVKIGSSDGSNGQTLLFHQEPKLWMKLLQRRLEQELLRNLKVLTSTNKATSPLKETPATTNGDFTEIKRSSLEYLNEQNEYQHVSIFNNHVLFYIGIFIINFKFKY